MCRSAASRASCDAHYLNQPAAENGGFHSTTGRHDAGIEVVVNVRRVKPSRSWRRLEKLREDGGLGSRNSGEMRGELPGVQRGGKEVQLAGRWFARTRQQA